MTSFNSASFPDSLAIAKESGLTIGSIDEIQKLHIRAVPMGEQARRLAHQDSSHTFLVTTSTEPPSMHTLPGPHLESQASKNFPQVYSASTGFVTTGMQAISHKGVSPLVCTPLVIRVCHS